jgi:hypothetical protein
MPGEPLFPAVRRLAGELRGGNDEHDPSGFDMPEHFRKPEFPGLENNGRLF